MDEENVAHTLELYSVIKSDMMSIAGEWMYLECIVKNYIESHALSPICNL